MRIDRIINKAKTLGIDTGNGTKPEQLEIIANYLEIEENDLDLIENELDRMQSDNEEFLDTPMNTNNEDVVTTSRRNIINRRNKSESLKNASKGRTQNKVKDASDKMGEINKSKEEVEDKVEKAEDASQKVETIKKVGRKSADAAVKIGRATAKGVSSLVTLIMANPLIAGAVAIIVLILLMVLIFAATDKDFTDGYFDGACNYNNTTVTYQSSIISLKNFVMGATYHYMQEVEDDGEEFTKNQIRALMIAIKTTTLAVGNYNSTTKSVSLEYDVDYTPIDEVPTDIRTNLENNYEQIERFLYISNTYKDVITTLDRSSKLDLSKGTIQKIKETTGSYNSILKKVYGSDSSTSSSSSSIDTSKPTIFVGDSRMVGMDTALSELDSNNTVAKGAQGYSWFRDTAISSIDSKITEGTSYNIISWLGVNDLYNLNNYFNKYKDLAEGKWKNHTIYVVQVGPVNESMYDQSSYAVKNAEVQEFNKNMADLISSSGLSNLVYLDIGLDQSKIDWDSLPKDGVHYSANDYRMIYNSIMNGAVGTSGKRIIYDLGDYCEFYKNEGSCNTGWWWPIGEGEPVNGIYVQPPAAWHTVINRGFTPSITFTGRPHYGTDIPANYGDVVVAAKDGKVYYTNNTCTELANINSTCGGYGGNKVYIDHGDGIVTLYMHMGKDTIVVKEGDMVRQGQKLGLASATGSATGPHLHFGMMVNGQYVDPLKYIMVDNTRPGGGVCNVGQYTNDIHGACLALKDLGLSNNAIIGILVNMHAEGFKTNVLELDYHIGGCRRTSSGGYYGYCVTGGIIGSFGASHEAYTEGINSGNYPRSSFISDRAGYGLIQWTDSGRKAGLYDYWVSQTGGPGGNRGIDDIGIQIGYMMQEINSGSSLYKPVVNAIQNNSSAYDIGYHFCNSYERPDQTIQSCSTRVNLYLSKYTSYVNNGCN